MNSNQSNSESLGPPANEVADDFGGISELIVPDAVSIEKAMQNGGLLIAST